jgi:hypothetical protein
LCGLACAEPPAEEVGPLLKTASCAPYKDLYFTVCWIVVSWTLIPHLSIFHMTEKIKIPAFSSKIIYLNIIVLHRSRFAIVN